MIQSYPLPRAFLRDTEKKRGSWGGLEEFEDGWRSDGVIRISKAGYPCRNCLCMGLKYESEYRNVLVIEF